MHLPALKRATGMHLNLNQRHKPLASAMGFLTDVARHLLCTSLPPATRSICAPKARSLASSFS